MHSRKYLAAQHAPANSSLPGVASSPDLVMSRRPPSNDPVQGPNLGRHQPVDHGARREELDVRGGRVSIRTGRSLASWLSTRGRTRPTDPGSIWDTSTV